MKIRALTFSAAAVAASVILSGCCCSVYEAKFNVGTPREKMDISKAPGKVKIDGIVDAKEWKGATVYNMVRSYRYNNPKTVPAKVYDHSSKKGKDVDPYQGGTVRLMYDNNYLYVAAHLTDTDINQIAEEDQLKVQGLGDALLVYVKPENSPSFWECAVAPNGKKATNFIPTRGYPANPDANKLMPGTMAAAKCVGTINNYHDKDTSWTVEFAIPVKELKKAGCDFKPGQKWTILIGRNNYNYGANDVEPQYSTWPELPSPNYSHVEYYADIIWK